MNEFTGGPAFPMREEKRERISKDMEAVTPGEWPGMSLRDYFAAKALDLFERKITIEVTAHGGGCTPTQIGETLAATVANTAYIVADAMLAERAKPRV